MSYYLDVHAHLTHEKFSNDLPDVIDRAEKNGLGAIVVNGLEPKSNRLILDLAKKYPIVFAALGIYPVDAVNKLLPNDFPFKVEPFDVLEEIKFIATMASKKELTAVGECGLDGHWLDHTTYAKQEEVFESLIEIAKKNDLPIIVHSRKLENRTIEILAHHKIEKVNMHCFGGKTKYAISAAEKYNWCFSIPAISHKNQAFVKMLRHLPPQCILTETDSPFLSPVRSTRNEPSNVLDTVKNLGMIRGMNLEDAKFLVYENFCRLFF